MIGRKALNASPEGDSAMFATKIIATCASALLLTAATFGAAEARIACDGDYQIVQGHEIYTPYCGDNRVAAKARAAGDRVTNSEVRNDPAFKDDLCRWMRGDKSLQVDCY
jgi:hypothetical protein